MQTKEQRPDVLDGVTFKQKTGCHDLFVIVNFKDEKPFEVFLTMGKAGGCSACQNEATGRLVSFSLRAGADIAGVIKQLDGVNCHRSNGNRLSCPSALAKVLKEITAEKKENTDV